LISESPKTQTLSSRRSNSREEEELKNCTFSPKISKKSQELSTAKRQKLIDDYRLSLHIEDDDDVVDNSSKQQSNPSSSSTNKSKNKYDLLNFMTLDSKRRLQDKEKKQLEKDEKESFIKNSNAHTSKHPKSPRTPNRNGGYGGTVSSTNKNTTKTNKESFNSLEGSQYIIKGGERQKDNSPSPASSPKRTRLPPSPVPDSTLFSPVPPSGLDGPITTDPATAEAISNLKKFGYYNVYDNINEQNKILKK
jgi:hypothetical protein